MFSSNTSAVSGDANYIEDVFSTWLYTGTGFTSGQTITNGIDLAGKGGLVFTKARNDTTPFAWIDTVRGAGYVMRSNGTGAQTSTSDTITAFGSTGYTLGQDSSDWGVNYGGYNYASWTFRKQPKFFDVATGTSNGSGNLTVNHALGSTPGCVIIKRTDAIEDWFVYHTSLGTSKSLFLNTTAAAANSPNWITVSSTSITAVGVNPSSNYVVYFFANDAGGFGLTGTDNVISCGSYTGNGLAAGPTVTLGYEPQFVLVKNTTLAGGSDWAMFDTMRGMGVDTQTDLRPNTTAAEGTLSNYIKPLATGFQPIQSTTIANRSGDTYIYIAIRRGPMKVPTDATKVFKPQAVTGTASTTTISGVGFAPDVLLSLRRTSATYQHLFSGRLTGTTLGTGSALATNSTVDEASCTNNVTSYNNDGITLGAYGTQGQNAATTYGYNFLSRAPSFFDEVCYTGNQQTAPITVNHNLGVVPELIIIKKRSAIGPWPTYCGLLSSPTTKLLNLNTTTGATTVGSSYWNNTTPTSTTFTVGTDNDVNGGNAADKFVAYLFATCAGVSKVGTYTGNGSSQTIACGFAAGARFVMIKRTDSTGDWYVWDTARGIVSGNDPHLSLNTTAAEVTTDDSVAPAAVGFSVNQVAATNINVNSATYLYLAIA